MNEPTNFNPPRTVPKPVCEEQIVDWRDDQPVIGYFYSEQGLLLMLYTAIENAESEEEKNTIRFLIESLRNAKTEV